MKKYSLKINGNAYEVEINSISSSAASVSVNGKAYDVEIDGGKVVAAAPVAAAPAAAPKAQPAPRPAAPAAAGGTQVKCPLPGTVTSINVKVGDSVAVGQTVAVLEAMKMQNNIDAEKAGTVKSVNVQAGATVMEGDVILVIE